MLIVVGGSQTTQEYTIGRCGRSCVGNVVDAVILILNLVQHRAHCSLYLLHNNNTTTIIGYSPVHWRHPREVTVMVLCMCLTIALNYREQGI